MTDLRLAAIVGSLRQGSFNRSVLAAARDLAPDHVVVLEVPLTDVPLYDGDLEAAGDPPAVAHLKTQVEAADGLLVVTPEYNRSTPAVTKNALDWLSRPPGSSVLADTPVGIVAATPGRHRAAGVRDHLATSFGAVTDGLFETTLGIGSIASLLDDDGRLVDADERQRLADWLGAFVRHIEELTP